MSRREALRAGGAALIGTAAITPVDAWAAVTGRCPHHRVRCHGSCCPPGEVCLPPKHKGGKHHCGCPHHLSRCHGKCVSLQHDLHNCGACGHTCAAGQHCVSGHCQPHCATGQTICAGVCVDLSSNPQHCGACGTVCAAGTACSAGRCVSQCPPGQMNCSGTCIDVSTDPNNCGACGTKCSSTEICTAGVCTACPPGKTACSGVCVDLQSDFNNCGACGTQCSNYFATSSCQSGTCHIDSCAPGWLDCDHNPLTGCEYLGTVCP